MLKVGERVVTRFCSGVNASISNTWSSISGFGSPTNNVKMMTRKNVDDPTEPLGFHLSVATSFWLPIPPKMVFNFLRDHNTRNQVHMQSPQNITLLHELMFRTLSKYYIIFSFIWSK